MSGSKHNRLIKLLLRTMRVWSYVRVSTPNQVRKAKDEFGSLEKQQAGIKWFVDAHAAQNWKITRPVSDPAESGDAIDRGGLQAILNGARKREFDILVIYNYDRLSRSWAQAQQIISELERLGIIIWVVAANTTITLRTPEGLMQAALAFIQAETELLRIRSRRSTDVRQCATQGIWQGGRVPMGFRAKKVGRSRMLIIYEREAKVILELLTRLAALEPAGQIIRDFTQRKILTPSHKVKRRGRWREIGRHPFTWDYIQKIARNPLYAGLTFLRNAEEHILEENMIFHRLSDGTVLFRGKHRGIVSPDLWLKAMSAINERPRVQRKARETDVEGRFSLQGIMYCSCCGHKMTPKGRGNGSGEYVAISVAQRSRYPDHVCKVRRIPASIIEDSVLTLFQRVIEKPDVIEEIVRHGSRRLGSLHTKNAAEISATLKKTVARCERLTACIGAAKTTGAGTAIVRELDEAIQARDQLQRELDALLADTPENLRSTNGIRSMLTSFAQFGGELNRKRMKELFRLWIFKCVVSVAKENQRSRVIRVELQVKQDPNLRDETCIPLRLEFEHTPKRQTYHIIKPFNEEREPRLSDKNKAVTEESPIEIFDKYNALAVTMRQREIAAKVGKTPAHVCQYLSLGKIDAAVRKRIRSAPPARKHHFTLNKLLMLKSLSPILQEVRVRDALAA